MSIAFAPEATRAITNDLVSVTNGRASVPTAPFGWYPDPAGSPMLRWWDGSRWTDRLESPRPEVQPAAGYSTRDLTANTP
jgi:Protein of unknown function (DUF2510)